LEGVDRAKGGFFGVLGTLLAEWLGVKALAKHFPGRSSKLCPVFFYLKKVEYRMIIVTCSICDIDKKDDFCYNAKSNVHLTLLGGGVP
jgi:hypothetical protein